MKKFKVAKILDSSTLYITGGEQDGIQKGDKFQISSRTGIEIEDPDSGKLLEIVPGEAKATVTAINVFEKVTMVRPIQEYDPFKISITSTGLLDVNPKDITGTGNNYSHSIQVGDIVIYKE